MNEKNLTTERHSLQQTKSSILYKAELVETKYKKARTEEDKIKIKKDVILYLLKTSLMTNQS